MAQTLKELKHVTKKTKNGASVIILNTGAVITSEAEAMLQALHSRSVGGIKSHLKTLTKTGADKFMSMFYVGYGHKSIGDCGDCTIFIENISMLAAKAIQDWKLYSGQEASTRYIDFAHQDFIDPLQSKKTTAIQEKWRAFYLKSMTPVCDHLKKQNPLNEGEKETIYEKAIAARAFDILRSFLPAGASTNISWHSNLRQVADKIMILRHHPLLEVREIAETIEEAVQKAYPNSFGHKRYETTEEYNKFWMTNKNYFTKEKPTDFKLSKELIDWDLIRQNKEVLSRRPEKTELPKYLAECGTLRFDFLLDFGSFRDIQRHRAVTQKMPLHTRAHGFAKWYIEELPTEVRKEALQLLKEQSASISKLKTTPEIEQYYNAMGYELPNSLTGDLPALVYLVELRATRFVHPTLCKRAIQIAKVLTEKFGKYGLVLHLDKEPNRFDIKRGEQDIVKKNQE